MLITQALESLYDSFGENCVIDLVSSCGFICVLGATSPKTQKMIIDWCGTYRARRKSWDGSGKHRKTSVAYEDQPIVHPDDLMTLQNTGELIMITPYGFARIKKTPYYLDKYFKPLATRIKTHNEAILKTLEGNDEE